MKVTLQSQATECGLACLAMVSSHHGRTLTLSQLRRKFPVSLKGMNLDALIRCAGALEFVTRALRLEINELQGVQLPCILHWRFNHFVVLERIDKTGFDILDPAVGKCKVTPEEFDRAFTGVALELHPVREFGRSTPTRERLRELVGTVTGLRTALARIAITALALQVLAIVSPLFNQLIIDEAIAKQDMNLATVLMIGFGLLLVTQTIIGQVKAWMSISLAQELALQWRTNVFAHLLKLPTSYFEGRHIGDITSRMSAVTQIQQTLTNSVVNAVVNALMAVGCGLMMVVYSWNLAGVAAIAAMLYGLLRFASYAPFRQATSERIRISARESTHIIETLRAVQSIKIFRKEASRLASWQNICVEGQNRDVRTAKMSQWFSTARTALTGAQGLVIFWLGAKAIIGGPSSGGALTIGMFFAFNAYQKQFSDAVSTLVDFFVEIKMLDLQRERLSDILDSVPECAEHSFAPIADGDIEIHNLGFRYSDTEPWIFRNISFTIRKGELFGISGPSGLGKSTLLKVILGVLEPSEGEIRYAGLQVESIGRKAYRAKFAAVMQNDILLGGSIADNIAYFEDSDNFDKIARCASAAGIAEDIAMMPMGYESLIGDLGSGVSGGQLQRIMLARALFAEAPILVLDEAMSNLDSETEKKIISTLKSIECTRIFVTHRHESLRHADRAFRLDRGSAVELDKSSNFLLAKV